jgi:hypothetical protein
VTRLNTMLAAFFTAWAIWLFAEPWLTPLLQRYQ